VSRREQVFWGWGEPGAGPELPEHAGAWLREHLGLSGEVVDRPVGLADVRLRAPALDAKVRERLAAVAEVRDDDEARVLRAAGKSYLDLLAQRAGNCEAAPDAVVAPRSAEAVAEVLRICAEADVAIVPFGGGTSVVGGVAPLRGERESLVSLDLGRLDRVLGVEGQLVRVQPGLRLPEADHALRGHGLTLGHFPQSYEWATVGGCVATRSSGQASTGFGRIDRNVVALRMATPQGELASREVPASAAGPSLREIAVGSEGVLGVITEVSLRARPLAAERRYEGFFLRSFADGCAVLRDLAEDGIAPDVARLSDEEETAASLALAGRAGLARVVGRLRPCLLVCGWEGDVGRRRREARRLLRGAGAFAAGQAAGRAWQRSRFAGPHLRDDLLDRGALVETLETAATWERLAGLRDAVAAALAGLHVGCHVSHVYPTGASLYFTALGRRDPADPAGQWQRHKAAACDAIMAAGGTITHHHAVGRDHAPWMEQEMGALGLDALRALKERLDPTGVLNPGKLLAA
jgi:alkyldihydroxyacetonephosphate synthase